MSAYNSTYFGALAGFRFQKDHLIADLSYGFAFSSILKDPIKGQDSTIMVKAGYQF